MLFSNKYSEWWAEYTSKYVSCWIVRSRWTLALRADNVIMCLAKNAGERKGNHCLKAMCERDKGSFSAYWSFNCCTSILSNQFSHDINTYRKLSDRLCSINCIESTVFISFSLFRGHFGNGDMSVWAIHRTVTFLFQLLTFAKYFSNSPLFVPVRWE